MLSLPTLVPMLRQPRVTICIPAHQSRPFIERCLASVTGQTYRKIKILISNDGWHDAEFLNLIEKKHGAQVVHQQDRLGWVENSNFLINQVHTPFFCILPHDDALEPTYVEETLNALSECPNAISAFSDIAFFNAAGDHTGILPGQSVSGTKAERILHVLKDGFNGHCYRALVRTPRRKAPLNLIDNPRFSFAVDSTWILQQALQGEMLCVPRPLYRKFIHGENTHQTWQTHKPKAIMKAWEIHCRTMAGLALRAAETTEDARNFLEAAESRYVRPHRLKPPPFPGYVYKAARKIWKTAEENELRHQFRDLVFQRELSKKQQERFGSDVFMR